ncbi:hemolysin family protein [Synechocystis sp. LKSZ1]|uniref:hemolysin family protein n=1 Tax=Synechocystis sp. LKSZ1 TaxID=3144951 RepID=UPI00336C094C
MSSIAFEIFLILVLIIANGVFSGSEIAIVSARKVRLEQLAKQGNRKARLALKLANSPNNFLSAVQIGITLIGILSGAVGGATVAQRLGVFLRDVPLLQTYSEPLSIFIVVTLITYLSLVIGELVPKRIALSHPEQLACQMAPAMQGLSRLTAPIVYLLGASTDTLLALLGVKSNESSPITEEEIRVLIEQGTQAGMFEEAEQEMVERVFRLGDRPIKTLMTPRTAIAWLDVDAPWEENQKEISETPYSRFPVGQDSLDDCLGFVRVKDILNAQWQGPVDLRRLVQPPIFVAESTRSLNVLEMFRQSGTHIALITDEYGGIEGLVTLNDLIEAIVGNIPNDDEIEEPQIIQREDGSWLLDGLLSIDQFKELFDRETLANEAEGNYHTLGGFIIETLGKIPQSGDYFLSDGLRLEVVDMDGIRIDKVLVSQLPSSEADDDPRAESETSEI